MGISHFFFIIFTFHIYVFCHEKFTEAGFLETFSWNKVGHREMNPLKQGFQQ